MAHRHFIILSRSVLLSCCLKYIVLRGQEGGVGMWLETFCKDRTISFIYHVSLKRQSARIPTELMLWERV